MRKKKNNKKYIIILGSLLVFFLLVLSLFFKDERKLGKFESIIKDSTIKVSNVLSTPFFSLKKTFSKKKINEYKDNLINIENITLNEEILKENEEMKKALNIDNTLSDREYIHATVINRNICYFNQEITINKGTNAGIDLNMAVMTSEGLIGKIINVSKNSSIVSLLTSGNLENKISVKVEYDGNFVYGLLSSYEDGYLVIDGISDNINIENGATVVTSGLSDIFPSGVMIGHVEDISSDNFDLVRKLYVKSDVNFNDLYFVTVLKRVVDKND